VEADYHKPGVGAKLLELYGVSKQIKDSGNELNSRFPILREMIDRTGNSYRIRARYLPGRTVEAP